MNLKTFIYIFFSLCIPTLSASKIIIFTQSYNRPDFIEIQYKTFQKFLQDEYEFIVFNDAVDPNIYAEIVRMCEHYNLQCIPMPQELHHPCNYPSVRHCSIIKYSLEKIGFNTNDIIAFIDSDLFLIREFNIRECMENIDLAGLECHRGHITYLWPGLIFLDMRTMPNKNTIAFECAIIDGICTDSGGSTYYYIKNNPDARVKYFDKIIYLDDFFCQTCKQNNHIVCDHKIDSMRDLSFSDPLIKMATACQNYSIEVYLQNTFLHYRAGSNWNNDSSDFHKNKTILLKNLINEILQ